MSGEPMRIGFTGDVSFSGIFARPAPPAERFAPEIVEFLRANHHNVLNVEGPLTDRPMQEGLGPTLASPGGVAAEALGFLGGRVWNLANNHTLDCGPAGLLDTLSHAEREGATCFGAGRTLEEAAAPLVLEQGGVRVGLLGVCDHSGVAAGDESAGVLAEEHDALVRLRIAQLRSQCDWVVFNYHGGEEFTFVPMPYRRRKLLRYLELGADVVVAHHAHTVQGWERRGSKLVFYGLGNFVFDHPTLLRRPGTYRGMILRLSFGSRGVEFETQFTAADRITGRIVPGSPAPSFVEVQPERLRQQWCSDAYRVVTLPREVAAENRGNGGPPEGAPVGTGAARGRGMWGRLRSLLYVARTPSYRRVVLGALEHRLRRGAGLTMAPTR